MVILSVVFAVFRPRTSQTAVTATNKSGNKQMIAMVMTKTRIMKNKNTNFAVKIKPKSMCQLKSI